MSSFDNGFMEPQTETPVQEKPHHEVISEKLAPFKDKLSPGVVELVAGDRTKEAGYKAEVSDNPYYPGLTNVRETWDGGSRNIRMYGESYQSRDTADNQPGDLEVQIEVNPGSTREIEIDTKIRAGTLNQRVICTTETASLAPFGKEPLMKGEFFKWAGKGRMTEDVIVSANGQTSRRREWSSDEWLGRGDRYRMTKVLEENGTIQHGVGEHGISVGYIPAMKVVSPVQK